MLHNTYNKLSKSVRSSVHHICIINYIQYGTIYCNIMQLVRQIFEYHDIKMLPIGLRVLSSAPLAT